MSRYVIETKQLSGQWLPPFYPVPSKTDHVAASKATAIEKADRFADRFGCAKRVRDTKTNVVIHTAGEASN